MIHIKNHPQLKRIRTKLIIEAILLIVFLAVYHNIFDGATKPLWVNILLIMAATLYILVDLFGYLTIKNPIQDNTINESLNKFYFKLNRIRIFSLISSFVFGLAVLEFFTTAFTEYGFLKFAVLFITLLFMIYLLHRSWTARIKQIEKVRVEFEELSNV
jgi:hypothetical protein